MPDGPKHGDGPYKSARPAAGGNGGNRFHRFGTARPFDWDEEYSADIFRVVTVACKHGDLVCFTHTSDGGALSVTILSAGVRHKIYCATPDEIPSTFRALTELLYGE